MKSYVIDTLIVLSLAVIIPRMCRRHWNARTAVVWVVGAVLIGVLSPFALVAALVGGVVVVAHPSDDLRYRVGGVERYRHSFMPVLTLAVRQTYAVGALQQWWQRTYDGFVVSHNGPFGIVTQAFVRLRHVTVVFSGGPSWWAALVLIADLSTLVLDGRIHETGTSRTSARSASCFSSLWRFLVA